MSDTVMITGTGRTYALGYNLVLRYLENGDTVIATVRKESEDLNRLKAEYGNRLHILIMDIGNSESVKNAVNSLSDEILRKLFVKIRYDKTGPRFLTNEGTEYPF